MTEQRTPRDVVKALLRGEPPSRPLLLPLTFALASRVDNLPLADFVTNPTKIVNGLRQVRATLRLDGVTCYFDRFLETEGLGGKINWTPEGPVLLESPGLADIEALRAQYGSEQILQNGRIPLVAEVLRRLKTLLKDEPALMVAITGPLKLATQLAGPARQATNELIEFAAEITAALAKHFVESGADVVFLRESLPEADAEIWPWWRGLLDPVINVVRFYESLPVLPVDETASSEQTSRILEENWECMICPSARILANPGSQSLTRGIGVAFPTALFAMPTGASEPDLAWVRQILEQVRPAFVTTAEDLPANADFKQVAKSLDLFRQTLLSVA